MPRTSDAVLQLAWTQAWQLAVLAIALAIIVRMTCRRRPHLAYLLWMLVVVKAVTPPVWSSPTSVFSWALSEPVAMRAPIEPTLPPIMPAPQVAPLAPSPASEPTPVVATQPQVKPTEHVASPLSGALLVLGLWSLGAVGLGGWLIVGWLSLVARLRACGKPASDRLQARFDELQQQLGPRRPVRLLVTDEMLGPAAMGWWRCTVIVPRTLVDNSSPRQLDAILTHELVHQRRFDPLLGSLQLAVQCLWWWHPAVWWANRQARIERERSCDEAVLAELDCRPVDYARLLVEILQWRQRLVPAVFWSGMSSSAATVRVRHVLDARAFHRKSPWFAWIISGALLMVVLPGAGWRFTVAAPPSDSPSLSSVVPDEAGPDDTPRTNADEKALIARLNKLGLRVTPVDVGGQRKLHADFAPDFEPLEEPLPLEDLPKLESIAINDRRDLNEQQLIARLRAIRNMRPETMLLVFFKPEDGAAFDVLAEIPNLQRLSILSWLPRQRGKNARKNSLAELKNLRELSFAGVVTDGTMNEVTPLDQLETLGLYLSYDVRFMDQSAPVGKVDLDCLENKPRLKRLITGGIQPTDKAFARIGELQNLEFLATSFTSATDEGMSQLAKLTKLKTLNLDTSQGPSRVTPEGLHAIGKLPNLVNLTVSKHPAADEVTTKGILDDRVIAGWSQLATLKSLHLFNCELTDASLVTISQLPSLVRLNLAGKLQIDDQGLAALGTMTNLKHLTLPGAAITDEGMAKLGPLTNLETLALYIAPQITDAGLAPLAAFAKLKELTITNGQIEGRGLAPITTLTSLSLENNPVDDAGVEIILRNKQLTSLNLSDTKITNRALELIGRHLPELRRLQILHNQVTDAGVAELKPLAHLQEVNASGSQVTEAAARASKGVLQINNDWNINGRVEFFSLEVE